MSSTDQQSAADAPAYPAEHEVPDALELAAEFDAATRDQWRELVAGVLRKAGRDDLPDPVEEALRRHRRDRRDGRAAVHRRGRRRPAARGRRARAARRSCAVPGPVRDPAGGVPGGWDVRQRHAAPRRRRHQGGDRGRPGERRHLAVAGARRRRDPGRRRSATCWPTSCSTWRR